MFRRCVTFVVALTLIATSGGVAAQTGVRVTRDVRYAGHDGTPLLLDIYRPTTGRDLPVLILVHGGSWRGGDKSDWADLAPRYAAEGYTVFVPNYRLAPRNGETLFPGAVDDLGLALAWARRQAHNYRGDPRRVGMLGSSAGGHLAILASGVDGDRPDAVGFFSPPVDLESLLERGVLVKAIRNFMGCDPEICPGRYRRASGLNAVDRQMPPTFLAFSANELIPRQQGRLFIHELQDKVVPHKVVELPGSLHGLGVARKVFLQTVEFMDRQL